MQRVGDDDTRVAEPGRQLAQEPLHGSGRSRPRLCDTLTETCIPFAPQQGPNHFCEAADASELADPRTGTLDRKVDSAGIFQSRDLRHSRH